MSISSDHNVPGTRNDGRYSSVPDWASPWDSVGVAGGEDRCLFRAAIPRSY